MIKHVFVLMMENRSFDHLFGYAGIIGVDGATGLATEVEGLTHRPGANSNPSTGQLIATEPSAPFNLRGVGKTQDVEHEFLDVLCQLCGSAHVPGDGRLVAGTYPPIDCSGFVADFVRKDPNAPPVTPMQCFTAGNLPVLNALANEFAICDHWFASHPGPTWPNRFYVHAASPSDEGQVDSPDNLAIAEAIVGFPISNRFHFANGTIYDRLHEKGLKHKIYAANGCPQVRGIEANSVDLNIARLTDLPGDLHQATYEFSYIFIEPDNGTAGFDGWAGGCESGTQNDMHPPSDVRDGEQLIKQVYEHIRNSPIWDEAVLVVTFDEHGGFFDHVAPPPAPPPGDGAIDHTHDFQFDRLGVRVPTLLISPLIRRNVVDHTQFDHTSVLASVERLFNLDSLTARDAAAQDFLHLFTEVEPRTDTPAVLNPYVDGAFLRAPASGQVYRVAGRAPLYINDWAPVGGIQPYVDVGALLLQQYPAFPADRTFIRGGDSQKVYRVAGGAPLYINDWGPVGGPWPSVDLTQWSIDNGADGHLRPVPADGTFIRGGDSQKVYRVAGGAPLYINDWGPVGGPQPSVDLTQWSIDNGADGHLRPVPADGTVLEGMPSQSYWEISGGRRQVGAPSDQAVKVTDFTISLIPPVVAGS
jgi:phospholipase C